MIEFVILWIGRFCLPFSFIIACCIAPIDMFKSRHSWYEEWLILWDDPL